MSEGVIGRKGEGSVRVGVSVCSTVERFETHVIIPSQWMLLNQKLW